MSAIYKQRVETHEDYVGVRCDRCAVEYHYPLKERQIGVHSSPPGWFVLSGETGPYNYQHQRVELCGNCALVVIAFARAEKRK